MFLFNRTWMVSLLLMAFGLQLNPGTVKLRFVICLRVFFGKVSIAWWTNLAPKMNTINLHSSPRKVWLGLSNKLEYKCSLPEVCLLSSEQTQWRSTFATWIRKGAKDEVIEVLEFAFQPKTFKVCFRLATPVYLAEHGLLLLRVHPCTWRALLIICKLRKLQWEVGSCDVDRWVVIFTSKMLGGKQLVRDGSCSLVAESEIRCLWNNIGFRNNFVKIQCW